MNTFSFGLDISKEVSHEVVVMRQADLDGTTIEATIYDHGAPYSVPSGRTVTAYVAIRLPGSKEYYRQQCTYSSGVCTAVINEEYACAIEGRTDVAYFELQLRNSGGTVTNIVTTANFTVIALRSATHGSSEGQRYDDEIAATVRQWLDDHPEATTTVQDDSLTAAKLKANSVTTAKIADGNVTTAKLADGSVTDTKLAANAVTTEKVANGSVTEAKLADNSVTNAKMADSAIGTAELIDGSVTMAKVASGAITTAKLDPNMFAVLSDNDILALIG